MIDHSLEPAKPSVSNLLSLPLLAACRYQVAREIRMHSELYHPHIISLFCAWKDASYIYVAVEWAPHGDVFSALRRSGGAGMPEAQVVSQVRRCSGDAHEAGGGACNMIDLLGCTRSRPS